MWAKTKLLVLLATLTVLGCASNQYGQPAGERVIVDFGTITDIRGVEVQPSHTTGAVIGGLIGLATGSGHSTESKVYRTIGGAAIGAAAEHAITSGQSSTEYTIELVNGQLVRLILDGPPRDLRRGDCVALETRGNRTSMYRTDSRDCQGTYGYDHRPG